MMTWLRIILCLCCAAVVFPASVEPSRVAPDNLDRLSLPWKGDLPVLLRERRPIRVLVSYNRTNFFMKEGVMCGLEADMMRAYEKYLVKTHNGAIIRMVFVPVPFNELVPALLSGRGDIIAAGLTVTAERERQVAFAAPYRTGVREVLVGGYASRVLHDVTDLSGRTVHVMASSSYAEHMVDDNAGLKAKGLVPIKVVPADPNLVTEDLLEMTSKGLIEYTVADEQLAAVWKEALPGLRVFSDWDIYSGGRLAWAVRPDCPALQQSLSVFAATVQQGTLLGNMFHRRYFQNGDHLTGSPGSMEIGNLKPLVKLFQKYSDKYNFDWLKIAALAYQESRFDMQLKSSMGAVGVMQIKPSTAAAPPISIQDVTILKNNIHAGVKYLRYLCDNYFKDVDSDARMNFALAAYNAGPGRIMQVRSRAESMGLDPNRWFGNAEWAALDLIGRETTAYVAHVQMYYAAYKASANILLQRKEAL